MSKTQIIKAKKGKDSLFCSTVAKNCFNKGKDYLTTKIEKHQIEK